MPSTHHLSDEVLESFIVIAEKNLEVLRDEYKASFNKDELAKVVVKLPKAPHVPAKLVITKLVEAPSKEKSGNVPPPELLARLLVLQPLAQQVRSNSPKYRVEAEEYSYLINQANVMYGVSMYRLAKLLGVTTSALAFRLVRYGYKTSEGKTKSYEKIKNRAS